MKPAAPFAPNAGRDSFFESGPVGEALQRLTDAMGDREPFLLVTGEPGAGKTALAREAVARWGDRVHPAWVSFPTHTEAELVEEIVRRLGVEPPAGASVPGLVACFEHALGEIAARGLLPVIVADDAHALDPAMLEALRMLVNAAQRAGHRLEVLLVGLPALEARLEEPALAALRQRISVRCRLEPLSSGDTRRYLHHRVSVVGGDGAGLFGRKACREIATQSRGLPREINALATEALRLARAAGQSTAGSDHVLAAAAGLWGRTLPGEADPEETAAPAAAAPASAPGANAAAPGNAGPKPAAVPEPATQGAAVEPTGGASGTRPPAKPAGTRHEPEPPVAHVRPAPQDPREWVNRFIGDQGPVRIGSRSAAQGSWGADDSEARAVSRPRPAAHVGEKAATGAPANPDVATPPAWAPAVAPARRGRRMPALAPALAALALVGVVVLLVRAAGSSHGRDAGTGRVALQHAPVTGSVPASDAPHAPVVTPVRANAGTAGVPLEVPVPAAPAAGTLEETAGSSRSTLDVASFLDPRRAGAERDRLHAATGLDAWVVRVPEAGGETYHVLLGIYRSTERAAAAADLLLGEGRVAQVRVVPLPPRRARR